MDLMYKFKTEGTHMKKNRFALFFGGLVLIGAIAASGFSIYQRTAVKQTVAVAQEVKTAAGTSTLVTLKTSAPTKDTATESKMLNTTTVNAKSDINSGKTNAKQTTTVSSPKTTATVSSSVSSSSNTVQVDRMTKAKQAAIKYIGSNDVGVYCIDLKSGQAFGINQNKIYYAASTAKLPGILYTQKKLNEKTISTATTYIYHDYVNDVTGAMIRGGTGILQNSAKDRLSVDVGTLLKDTCSYSDNLASNMLGYYVCDKNSGSFLSYISGIIGRNIDPFSKEFSARETALLMNAIYNQGGQAITNLQNTSWNKTKIPEYLPVKVAHKIGVNGYYNHDVAVVYSSKPYVLSIMTNGNSDEFIAHLSKVIYDALN